MDNANLAKLRISPGKLLPNFSSDVTQYSATVSSSIEEVRISYQTSDTGASCNMKGGNEDKTVRLTEGEIRRVELIITAEDGKTVKIYSLTLRRLSADDAVLSDLETSIGTLIPRFDPSVEEYCCYLPCNLHTLSLKAATEDQAMSVGMADGATPMDAIPLNPGYTSVKLKVCSANGKGTKHYVIRVIKRPIPYVMELPSSRDKMSLTCSICCSVLYRPSHTVHGMQMYCLPCLEELTRTNKTDIFTGHKLEGEWLIEDLAAEAQLSKTQAVCRTPTGDVAGLIGSIVVLLCKERNTEKKDEPTENCPECSKKVPTVNMNVHKELLCLAKYTSSLSKQEVKAQSWEVRLVDCTLGNNVQSILTTANTIETEYLTALSTSEPSCQELLQRAASCYATAAKLAPGDVKAHLGLALIMEELFYAEDIYGIKKEEETESETEEETSANQEEFAAICKLHGVNPTADGIAQQLKAVEAEYHSLKLSGQMYKAEHVQQLHAWKSKQASQASQGTMAIEMEGTIARALKKLRDCVSINPSDGTSCYNLGRLSLLSEEYETAAAYLKAALAIMPLFTPACLCLGLALSSQNPTYTAILLYQGLSEYLATREYDCATNATEPSRHKEILSRSFYRPTNTLIIEGFLTLAEVGGHNFLVPEVCLMYAARCITDAHFTHRGATYRKCLWLSLKARSMLLQILLKRKDSMALKHSRELRLLVINSGLSPVDNFRALQMQVCQMGVILQPNSSEALCHLGNAQLAEYEAKGDVRSLQESELSFKASISQEGADIDPDVVPEELEGQDWWKIHKSQQSNTKVNKSTDKISESKKPQGTPNKQPAGQPKGASQRITPSKAPAKPPATTTPSGNKTVSKSCGASIPAKAVTKPSGTGPIPAKAVAKPSGTSIPPKAVNKPSCAGTSVPPKAVTKPSRGTTIPPKTTKPPSAQSKTTNKPSDGITNTVDSSAGDQSHVEAGSQVPVTTSQVPSLLPDVNPTSKERNKKSYIPRLGMARALAKSPEHNSKTVSLYREVIAMAPELHEAYIELGATLSKTEPLAAVDIYCCFPFSNPPSFDDAFLHGEVVRILMNAEKYEDCRLCSSLISLGRAMGIGVLEKHVAVLEAKFKTSLLKDVYAGVHGKPVTDPDLQQFFKFKCW